MSRSEEAKALGITMGVPYFKVRDLCDRHGVVAFSSNFDLYRDLSRRVMSVIRRFSDSVEVYSVDEAFAEVDVSPVYYEDFAVALRDEVMHVTGIPVAVGIAPTKTLAKVATHFAKPKRGGSGAHVFVQPADWLPMLEHVSVGDVWGVGYRLTPKLEAKGITTAGGLTRQDDRWIRKHMSVCGLRTVYELRGVRCFALGEEPELRKSLLHSQSFGRAAADKSTVHAAVSYHARKVAEVLRAEGAQARSVYVTIRTGRHGRERYSAFDGDTLPLATNDTLDIVGTASQVLERIFKPGVRYAKAGVLVRDIVPVGLQPQRTLFGETTRSRTTLMEALDELRHRFGDRIHIGSEKVGMSETEHWRAKHDRLSPRYTTRWSDIRTVGAGSA